MSITFFRLKNLAHWRVIAIFTHTNAKCTFRKQVFRNSSIQKIKGHNEIDIIAVDEFSGKLEIYEVKRQAKELDINALRNKTEFFLQIAGDYKHYKIYHIGLSIEDMK